MLRDKSTLVVKIAQRACAGCATREEKAAAAETLSVWLVENGRPVGCIGYGVTVVMKLSQPIEGRCPQRCACEP
jgi:hypothetical protein